MICDGQAQLPNTITNYQYLYKLAPSDQMPKNSKKTHNPLAPTSKSKRKNKAPNDLERNIEDFIDDYDQSDEHQIKKPKMKRLKKQRQDQSEEEELFVQQNKSEDSWKAEGSEEDKNQSDYERYGLVDDEDLQKQKEQQQKKKKKKKLKGNQEIDRFMGKSLGKQAKKQEEKQKKKQTQMSLLSMLQKQKPRKKKDSFDEEMANIEIDEDISNISEMNNYNIKAENKEQEELQKAIQLSKMELEKQQQKIYRSITSPNLGQKQNHDKELDQALRLSLIEEEEEKNKKKERNNDKSKKKVTKNQGKKSTKEPEVKGLLSGIQVAFTGEFQPYKKGKLIELFEQLGAKCPKSLTKKATHLFQGAYVADQYGRRLDQDPTTTSKSRQAQERGISIISNDQIDQFMLKHTGKTLEQLIEKQKRGVQSTLKLVDVQKTGSKTLELDHEEMEIEDEHEKIKFDSDDKTLWTQKYKPKQLDEIIGQKSQINQLKEWLQAWEDIHVHGNKRQVKGSFNSFLPSGNINSKAALLSGDAGIGKTTTARLLAVKYNYGIVEYNASQSRNKKSVANISGGKDNYWLAGSTAFAKTLIIMDEIDGMSSGDRGGITAIIDMIKKSKVPIICICNDRQSQKIRSLAGHCNDIKFHKPDKTQIVKRLSQIIIKEGGTYTSKGLERLIETMQNDMRQTLTYLEFFFKSVSHNINYDTIERHPGQSKDNAIMLNHFQASKRLMNRVSFQNLNINERIELAFIDSDFVPLMVHQNYLLTGPKKKMNRQQFHKVVKATEGIVEGDLLQRKIMRNQTYVVMPNKMFLTCVYPTQMMSQNCGFAKFTNWLGKFSSQRKTKRLIRQLKYCLGVNSLVTTRSVKYNYSPMMFKWLVEHLKESQIDQILDFMDFYHISPEIFNENIAVLQLGSKKDQLKNIPAPVKTKLTKAYNARHEKLTKGKKAKTQKTEKQTVMGKFDPVLGEMQVEIMEQEEENIEEESNELPLKKEKVSKQKKK